MKRALAMLGTAAACALCVRGARADVPRRTSALSWTRVAFPTGSARTAR